MALCVSSTTAEKRACSQQTVQNTTRHGEKDVPIVNVYLCVCLIDAAQRHSASQAVHLGSEVFCDEETFFNQPKEQVGFFFLNDFCFFISNKIINYPQNMNPVEIKVE